MQIHDLNTKALTNPAYVAFDDGTDTYKADFKAEIDNAAADAVADADLTDNTVAFTSGDAASPTGWTAVGVLTSGLSLKTLLNRISTMVKNVRYIWSKIGTASMGTTATTITGAIAEHESDISTLNSKISSGTSVSVSDFITVSSGITLASSGNVIYKTANHIYAKLMFTGTAISNAAGYFNVGTLNTAYRPTAPQAKGVTINNSAGGQVRSPAVIELFSGGIIRITTGEISKTYGNATYSWATDSGIVIDYAL